MDKDGQKTGGRKKGTPNKKTVEVFNIFQKHNFCPIESMIEVFNNAKSDYLEAKKLKEKAAEGLMPVDNFVDQAPQYLKICGDMGKELAQYLYPKRKALEVKADTASVPTIKLQYSLDAPKNKHSNDK